MSAKRLTAAKRKREQQDQADEDNDNEVVYRDDTAPIQQLLEDSFRRQDQQHNRNNINRHGEAVAAASPHESRPLAARSSKNSAP